MKLTIVWFRPFAFAVLALSFVVTSCTTRLHNPMPVVTEGRIKIDSADFEAGTTHAVGRAHCHCVFWLVVSGSPDIKNRAWREMKRNAGLEGKAGHFINVTVEQAWRWVVYPFYWQEHYVVSADTVLFPDGTAAGGPAGGVSP